jgi:3-hydroxyacyl-[acyl-carrier-protein] dehydratase
MVSMDIGEILRFLPHRYPFLLLDRVLEFTVNERLTALKNVTINEPFFQGHFPGRPVMPGVLILETMAQATGVLALHGMPEHVANDNSIYYFVGIDKARFRKPVLPGDQLIVEVVQKRKARGVIKADASASVNGVVVAQAEIMGAMRELED